MVHPTERQLFRIVRHQESESTFQKQKANEAAIEARIAAQRQARLASKAKKPEAAYDGELVRNARIAGRYGQTMPRTASRAANECVLNLAALESEIAEATVHVVRGRDHIRRQLLLIEELQRGRHDIKQAKEIAKTFLETQALHEADVERLQLALGLRLESRARVL
jgi:hypothetical protein